MILFYDDAKIDLTLLPPDLMEEYFTWDKLVKILLDRDRHISQPYPPYDENISAYVVRQKEKYGCVPF